MLQTPAVTASLDETLVGMIFRQVFTDGRPLPAVSEPTWLGYSVGRWDGDTCGRYNGLRDAGWLDTKVGRPHRDARASASGSGEPISAHLELTIRIDDPKAYLKPWTVSTTLILQPDTELLETFCDRHEKTMEHRRITAARGRSRQSPGASAGDR